MDWSSESLGYLKLGSTVVTALIGVVAALSETKREGKITNWGWVAFTLLLISIASSFTLQTGELFQMRKQRVEAALAKESEARNIKRILIPLKPLTVDLELEFDTSAPRVQQYLKRVAQELRPRNDFPEVPITIRTRPQISELVDYAVPFLQILVVNQKEKKSLFFDFTPERYEYLYLPSTAKTPSKLLFRLSGSPWIVPPQKMDSFYDVYGADFAVINSFEEIPVRIRSVRLSHESYETGWSDRTGGGYAKTDRMPIAGKTLVKLAPES